MILPYIVVGFLAFIIVGVIITLAFMAGWLRANQEYLDYLDAERDKAITAHSWASVNAAQAEFNSDFFEELWAANDSRLTIG